MQNEISILFTNNIRAISFDVKKEENIFLSFLLYFILNFILLSFSSLFYEVT